MKKIPVLFIIFIFTITSNLFSQKVYKVEYESQADLKVYAVNYESQADLNVYKVQYESQAGKGGLWYNAAYESQSDFRLYFVEYESQADLKIFLRNTNRGADGKINRNSIYLSLRIRIDVNSFKSEIRNLKSEIH